MISATNHQDTKFFYEKTNYVPTMQFNGMKLTAPTGKILSMVGFDYWTPNSVQMHIFIDSPKAMTRHFIREVFAYVFITANRKLVIGLTPGDNAPALEFNRRIGFKEMYRVVDGWSDGIDIVEQELRRDDCRWLRRH